MTDQELAEVMALTEAASVHWMQGNWDDGYGALLTDADDASIFGPFGGPATTGSDNWAARAAVGVKVFRAGRATLKLVRSYMADNLLVLVLMEQQAGEIDGVTDHPWSLRVTQVYRREGGAWKVVHRHADPLVRPRTLTETMALAAG